LYVLKVQGLKRSIKKTSKTTQNAFGIRATLSRTPEH